MKKFYGHILVSGVLLCCISCGDQHTGLGPDFENPWFLLKLDSTELLVTEVVRDLDQPWEITWGSDDNLWFTEKKGNVFRMDPATGYQKKVLSIPDVYAGGNTPGLLGMVLHPDFKTNPFVYMHYTYVDSSIVGEVDGRGRPNMIRSRVVRYEYQSHSDTLAFSDVLLPDIMASRAHNGSRLIITEDRKILFAIGDVVNGKGAQDRNVLTGKILRMNLDGSIPEDNPMPGSYVYSLGHRNHQGLVLARGKIYTSEHGPNNDDELNLIRPDKNYGWPYVEGYCNTDNELLFCDTVSVTEPLFIWTPTVSPAGLDYYDHPAIPEWRNSLILTTLKGRSLQLFKLDQSGEKIEKQRIYLQKQFGRLRDLCVSSSGDVYLITSNTDWHIPRYKWMYDNVPEEGNDRIIKLSRLEEPTDAHGKLSVIREDSAQIRLFVQDEVDENIPGAGLYQTHCAPCHLPGGEGIADFTPPLTDTRWVADKENLIATTLFGLSGEIDVKGLKYDEVMPGFAALLNDQELAELLDFVMSELNNYEDTVTAEDIGKIRGTAQP